MLRPFPSTKVKHIHLSFPPKDHKNSPGLLPLRTESVLLFLSTKSSVLSYRGSVGPSVTRLGLVPLSCSTPSRLSEGKEKTSRDNVKVKCINTKAPTPNCTSDDTGDGGCVWYDCLIICPTSPQRQVPD